MKQILVYGDSLTWGIIPGTRERLPFEQRWPGIVEANLNAGSPNVRMIEDCLNGRRTVLEDPFKEGRNGLIGLQQRIEVNTPLAMVIIALGVNDFQSMHAYNADLSALGIQTLITAVRSAPIEPTMGVPKIMVMAPPALKPPRGFITPKFTGGDKKSVGLAEAYRNIAHANDCEFFDAGSVITTSDEDGVHLTADQTNVLGQAMTKKVGEVLGIL